MPTEVATSRFPCPKARGNGKRALSAARPLNWSELRIGSAQRGPRFPPARLRGARGARAGAGASAPVGLPGAPAIEPVRTLPAAGRARGGGEDRVHLPRRKEGGVVTAPDRRISTQARDPRPRHEKAENGVQAPTTHATAPGPQVSTTSLRLHFRTMDSLRSWSA